MTTEEMCGLTEKQYKIVWAGALRYGMTEKQADELPGEKKKEATR